MAILIKKIFGNLSGALGDSVFRNRYGKVVAYSKPTKQRISKSAASKKARKQFALTVAFAKKLNSLPALAAIWRYSKISSSSAYHKIIKHNNKLTSVNSLTVNNIIVPKSGFIAIKDLNLMGDILKISFTSAFSVLLKNLDDEINLTVIFYLYKRRLLLTPGFVLLDKTFTFNSQFVHPVLELNLNHVNIPFYKYNNAIIYAAVLFDMGNKTGNSDTFAREIVHR